MILIKYFLLIIIASSFGCVDTKGKIEEIPGEFINTLEKEAPILAAKVRDGKIPSLSERIPQNPLVAKHDYIGYEGPGVYGGTWRHFHNDTNQACQCFNSVKKLFFLIPRLLTRTAY